MKIFFYTLLLVMISLSAQSQSCLFFDGINDKITGNPAALNNIGEGDFTVEAWIEAEVLQEANFPMILSNRLSESDGMFFFFHSGNPIKGLGVQLNASNYFIENNGTAGDILDGMRHHVAITLSNEILIFYIDGEMIGERNIFGGTPTASGEGPLLIGRDTPTGNTFRGILSNIRVWDVARSLEEILSTMNVELLGEIDNLVMNFHLNEGEGSQVKDHSTGSFSIFGDDDFNEFEYPTWLEDCNTFTAIKDIYYSQIISAFPNPTSNYFYVELDDIYLSVDVAVYDVNGKVVLRDLCYNASTVELDISKISSGQYIIQLITDKNVSVTKMLVTK